MTKTPEPAYDTYEPGEPEDLAAKKAKKDHQIKRLRKFKDGLKTVGWIALFLAIAVGIVFGINRLVHSTNEGNRQGQAFYAVCVAAGNHQYGYQNQIICFEGVVTSVDSSDDKGIKQCMTNGDYPITDTRGFYPLCVRGKIIAIR